MAAPQHHSSAKPLAAIYAALVVYASLYPFEGWRSIDEGLFAFLVLPWPRWWTAFDLTANLLGYVPLGALIFGAMVRAGQPVRRAIAAAWLLTTMLSLGLEVSQNFLTRRVASNVDLTFNSLGAAIGISLALAIHKLGWVERWQGVRDRWFIGRSAGGLALLVLWPLGLLFPTPVALGLGRGLPRLHEPLAALFEGTALSHWFGDGSRPFQAFVPMSPIAEVATIALGILAPSLLAFTITRPGWRRLMVVLGLLGLGFTTTTLSTALNFGPQHALTWLTLLAMLGLVIGALLAMITSRFEARICIALGLVVLTAMIVAVAQAPADPYFSQSLQAWEQGDFIRFHGAAQWVGWLWPFVALVYLLIRVGRSDQHESASGKRT